MSNTQLRHTYESSPDFSASLQNAAELNVTREQIFAQLPRAYADYAAITTFLAGHNPSVPLVEEYAAADMLEAWLTEDKLSYVTAAQTTEDRTFSLVLTPSSTTDIAALVMTAQTLSRSPVFDAPGLSVTSLKPQQSGAPQNEIRPAVNFCLVPNAPESELFDGTASEQRTMMREVQSMHGFLRTPSIIEAISHQLRVVAGNGQTQLSRNFFEQTSSRHLDIETPDPHMLGETLVLHSCLADGGQISFSWRSARSEEELRLIVA